MIELVLLFLGAHFEPGNNFCYEQPAWFWNIWEWNSQGLLEGNSWANAWDYLFEHGIIYKVDPNTDGCYDLGIRPHGSGNV